MEKKFARCTKSHADVGAAPLGATEPLSSRFGSDAVAGMLPFLGEIGRDDGDVLFGDPPREDAGAPAAVFVDSALSATSAEFDAARGWFSTAIGGGTDSPCTPPLLGTCRGCCSSSNPFARSSAPAFTFASFALFDALRDVVEHASRTLFRTEIICAPNASRFSCSPETDGAWRLEV